MDSPSFTPSNYRGTEDSIFEDSHYKEVQQDIWLHERKKTITSLIAIGGILLLGDLLGLLLANSLSSLVMLMILVIPAIYFGLAYIARFKPMLAVILGTSLFVLILAYNLYLLGGKGIFNGLFLKAAIIFFIFKGFRHAKDAEDARKNLDVFP